MQQRPSWSKSNNTVCHETLSRRRVVRRGFHPKRGVKPAVYSFALALKTSVSRMLEEGPTPKQFADTSLGRPTVWVLSRGFIAGTLITTGTVCDLDTVWENRLR